MEEIKANILTHPAHYIVQQNNCLAVKSHGLSKDIYQKFPYAKVYEARKPLRKGLNLACKKDRATPGTISIFSCPFVSSLPKIVCMFAQYEMGKPGEYKRVDHIDSHTDTSKDREQWFQECLTKFKSYLIKKHSTCSPDHNNKENHCGGPILISIPFKIGCGLAGGNWERYHNILTTWAHDLQTEAKEITWKISLCCL